MDHCRSRYLGGSSIEWIGNDSCGGAPAPEEMVSETPVPSQPITRVPEAGAGTGAGAARGLLRFNTDTTRCLAGAFIYRHMHDARRMTRRSYLLHMDSYSSRASRLSNSDPSSHPAKPPPYGRPPRRTSTWLGFITLGGQTRFQVLPNELTIHCFVASAQRSNHSANHLCSKHPCLAASPQCRAARRSYWR